MYLFSPEGLVLWISRKKRVRRPDREPAGIAKDVGQGDLVGPLTGAARPAAGAGERVVVADATARRLAAYHFHRLDGSLLMPHRAISCCKTPLAGRSAANYCAGLWISA
jgi:hypothetical protein